MILRRIALKNYRKFRALEIEFPAGLLGVVGRNGAGKTTLLEAVAFALYGTQASRTKAKGIRRDGAAENEVCEVETEFSVGGDPYRLVRRLKGINETQQAELYRGGGSEPIATQPVGVTAAVRKLLGMDYSTFTRSVYSKQREINALSDARPDERRGAIRRMVGIETITRARDAARSERRQKEAEVEGARRAIEDLPVKKAELRKIKEELQVARLAIKETSRVAVAAAKMVRSTLDELNRQETKRSKAAGLEKEKSGLAGDLRGAVRREDGLRKEITLLANAKAELAKLLPEDRAFERVCDRKEKLDKASGKYEERVEVEREVGGLRRDLEKTKSELASARQRISTFVRVAPVERAARSKERKTRAAVTRLQKARGNAQRKVGGAESQRHKAERALSDVRRLGPGGQCPTCYRALGDSFENIISHLRRERDRYAAESKVIKDNIKEIEAQTRAAEKEVGEAVRDVQTATKEAKAAARAKEKLAAARENHARASRALREKLVRLRTLRKVKYNAERHSEVVEQHRRLSEVHDRVGGLMQAVDRAPQVKKGHRESIREIQTLRKQITTVERRETTLKFADAEYASAR
jgi:exonuclease SbcC